MILAVFSVAILSLGSATSTFAITPTFGHRYQNGVGNVSAWLNTASGVGYWSTYITGGANNWMYPGWSNPIYINFVGSNYGSMMDFHQNNDAYWGGGMTVLAETKFFNSGGGQIGPTSANWAYAEIHINNDTFRSPSFSNAQAQGTVIHEMGHAFGLAHDQGNPYSIMCQTGAGRIVQSVQKVDNDAILTLY
jgi:hypothetical protein